MLRFTRELRQSFRALRQRKAYYVTCAATLALVLGANAAILAVVSATMLRPMPFDASGPVVQLYAQPPGTTGVLQRNPLQQMEVPRLRERARTIARLEGFFVSERVLTLGAEPATVQAAAVTPGFMSLVGASTTAGRLFAPVEGEPGHQVAVITDRFWRGTLGAASVVGTPLVIDAVPHIIIGVLSPAFDVPFVDAQVFTPLVASAEPQPRSPPRSVVGLAELAPHVSLAQAREELTTIYQQFGQEFPRTHSGWTIGAVPAREWQYGSIRTPLLMLVAAMALVVLIACVNIANMTSAEIIARAGETSLRLALGASSVDVIRVHLAELLIVCLSGLVPGLLLAWWAVPALLTINPTFANTLGPVTIDWRVQTMTLGVALLTAVAASAIPAIRAARTPAAGALTGSSLRTTGGPRTVRWRRMFVSLEIALCLALLMAGTVVMQGLRDLQTRGPGFTMRGVLTAQVRLPQASYETLELRAAVVKRMLDAIRVLPGVESASTTQNAFLPSFSYQTLLSVKDHPTPDGQPYTVQFRRVSADYFTTMRIRTLDGRVISEDDVAGSPPVVVVSRRFAETALAGLAPVGQMLVRNNPPNATVVGVVDDVADVSVTATPEATVYFPWAQNNNFGVPVAFVIRTSGDPSALVAPVREAVRRIDPTLPLRRVQPLETFAAESTAPERFRTMVLGIVAMLGLLLAAVGISGVTSRGVVDRTRDFAVRMALGAAPAAVMRLVIAELLRDLAVGALLGLAGGWALAALLKSSMTNIGALNAFTVGVAVVVIGVVGVVAAMVPARRVLGVQPAEVLRR
jgi:predicted permease